MKILNLIILTLLVYSCSPKPSNDEIISLLNTMDNFKVKEFAIEPNGKSYKINDTRVFPYIIIKNYIWPGLLYGYISECPEYQCHKDTWHNNMTEYLLYKNHWNKWDIYDKHVIHDRVITFFWRPISISEEVFYKDFDFEFDAGSNVAPEVKF